MKRITGNEQLAVAIFRGTETEVLPLEWVTNVAATPQRVLARGPSVLVHAGFFCRLRRLVRLDLNGHREASNLTN